MDTTQGDPLAAWRAVGSPDYPTPAQLAEVRAAAEPALLRDEVLDLDESVSVTVDLPPCAFARVELARV